MLAQVVESRAETGMEAAEIIRSFKTTSETVKRKPDMEKK